MSANDKTKSAKWAEYHRLRRLATVGIVLPPGYEEEDIEISAGTEADRRIIGEAVRAMYGGRDDE